jgi:para-aminobenzoate synthetase component 1
MHVPPVPYISFTDMCLYMDEKGIKGEAFVFFIDYKASQGWIGTLDEAKKMGIAFSIAEKTLKPKAIPDFHFEKYPILPETYAIKFRAVKQALHRGDSFLVNLTQVTPINCSLTLEEIFESAQATYKLYVPGQFVVFSPETFIKVHKTQISSYPMKGTLSVKYNPSPAVLQSNAKEQAEHATIVDLIRNDVSQVAFPIQVEKYKYIDQIKSHEGDLWQMSSKISGELLPEYQGKLGSILQKLLPAGSISGAPKPSTLRIIEEIEGYERGFYTGIMGQFDGQELNTGVMIRFIEQQNDNLFFKSGGGITVFSDEETEYLELIQKVYLPF